jgi:hypothetical protein
LKISNEEQNRISEICSIDGFKEIIMIYNKAKHNFRISFYVSIDKTIIKLKLQEDFIKMTNCKKINNNFDVLDKAEKIYELVKSFI